MVSRDTACDVFFCRAWANALRCVMMAVPNREERECVLRCGLRNWTRALAGECRGEFGWLWDNIHSQLRESWV